MCHALAAGGGGSRFRDVYGTPRSPFARDKPHDATCGVPCLVYLHTFRGPLLEGEKVTNGWSESRSFFQYHVTFWSHGANIYMCFLI